MDITKCCLADFHSTNPFGLSILISMMSLWSEMFGFILYTCTFLFCSNKDNTSVSSQKENGMLELL